MFADEKDLEQELSRPSAGLVADARSWQGDVIVLGAGGKIGSGVATMARRALDEAGRGEVRVLAVSRWTDAEARARLDATGVETVIADLSDPAAVDELPDAANVVFLVGAKFGTSTNSDEAWMTNTVLPAYVARRYATSRITALSTGNVYPMTSPMSGGRSRPTRPVRSGVRHHMPWSRAGLHSRCPDPRYPRRARPAQLRVRTPLRRRRGHRPPGARR
ncbi:NAD-dependent epimerase/dehydratase family protein [Prescottella defluvii]|nr:NAD-dependent epimerase/dehydratase family protein [Prescottella defluvii]